MANTKLRWFSSSNKNAPALDNSWGALIKLFDACLINGYSSQSISSATVFGKTPEASNYVTFTYSEPHGYLQYQVLLVTGATVDPLNGEHRILEVSSDGLSLTFKLKESLTDPGPVLNIITSLAPINWKKTFEDGSKRAVYKSNSEEGQNASYFVFNDQPHSTYTTTWHKYASFLMAEDNEGWENKGLSTPSGTSGMYATSGSGNTLVMGPNKIIYATNTNNLTSSSYAYNVAAAGNRNWFLIGDERTFYFIHATVANTDAFAITGFGQYDTVHNGFEQNSFMSTFTWNTSANTNYSIANDCHALTHTSYNYARTLKTATSTGPSSLAPFSVNGISTSGYTNVFSTDVPTNLFTVYCKDSNSNALMGVYRNIYWLGVVQPFIHKQVFKQGSDIFMALSSYSLSLIHI